MDSLRKVIEDSGNEQNMAILNRANLKHEARVTQREVWLMREEVRCHFIFLTFITTTFGLSVRGASFM